MRRQLTSHVSVKQTWDEIACCTRRKQGKKEHAFQLRCVVRCHGLPLPLWPLSIQGNFKIDRVLVRHPWFLVGRSACLSRPGPLTNKRPKHHRTVDAFVCSFVCSFGLGLPAPTAAAARKWATADLPPSAVQHIFFSLLHLGWGNYKKRFFFFWYIVRCPFR